MFQMEIEKVKKDWELNRLKQIKVEEERKAELEEDEMMYTYTNAEVVKKKSKKKLSKNVINSRNKSNRAKHLNSATGGNYSKTGKRIDMAGGSKSKIHASMSVAKTNSREINTRRKSIRHVTSMLNASLAKSSSPESKNASRSNNSQDRRSSLSGVSIHRNKSSNNNKRKLSIIKNLSKNKKSVSKSASFSPKAKITSNNTSIVGSGSLIDDELIKFNKQQKQEKKEQSNERQLKQEEKKEQQREQADKVAIAKPAIKRTSKATIAFRLAEAEAAAAAATSLASNSFNYSPLEAKEKNIDKKSNKSPDIPSAITDKSRRSKKGAGEKLQMHISAATTPAANISPKLRFDLSADSKLESFATVDDDNDEMFSSRIITPSSIVCPYLPPLPDLVDSNEPSSDIKNLNDFKTETEKIHAIKKRTVKQKSSDRASIAKQLNETNSILVEKIEQIQNSNLVANIPTNSLNSMLSSFPVASTSVQKNQLFSAQFNPSIQYKTIYRPQTQINISTSGSSSSLIAQPVVQNQPHTIVGAPKPIITLSNPSQTIKLLTPTINYQSTIPSLSSTVSGANPKPVLVTTRINQPLTNQIVTSTANPPQKVLLIQSALKSVQSPQPAQIGTSNNVAATIRSLPSSSNLNNSNRIIILNASSAINSQQTNSSLVTKSTNAFVNLPKLQTTLTPLLTTANANLASSLNLPNRSSLVYTAIPNTSRSNTVATIDLLRQQQHQQEKK
jgi:hypothetical protein